MNIKFKQPQTLDGKQLIGELTAAGIVVVDIPSIDADGNLWLNLQITDEHKAKPIIAAHVASTTVATVADKLASVGLSIEELKAALA